MRKAKVSPSFEIYLKGLTKGQPVELILVGHLVVEALLVEIINLTIKGDKPWKWSYPDKVAHCLKLGLIDAKQQATLLRLNEIRNDFAHSLGHTLNFDDVFAYVKEMAAAGYEFSDTTIYEDKSLSEEWYGFDGVIIEILNELYFGLAEVLATNGGSDRRGG